MKKKMLRTGQVAKKLGVTQKTVWNWIQRGSFPGARKLDPHNKSIWLIPENDVKKYVAENIIYEDL